MHQVSIVFVLAVMVIGDCGMALPLDQPGYLRNQYFSYYNRYQVIVWVIY